MSIQAYCDPELVPIIRFEKDEACGLGRVESEIVSGSASGLHPHLRVGIEEVEDEAGEFFLGGADGGGPAGIAAEDSDFGVIAAYGSGAVEDDGVAAFFFHFGFGVGAGAVVGIMVFQGEADDDAFAFPSAETGEDVGRGL